METNEDQFVYLFHSKRFLSKGRFKSSLKCVPVNRRLLCSAPTEDQLKTKQSRLSRAKEFFIIRQRHQRRLSPPIES